MSGMWKWFFYYLVSEDNIQENKTCENCQNENQVRISENEENNEKNPDEQNVVIPNEENICDECKKAEVQAE